MVQQRERTVAEHQGQTGDNRHHEAAGTVLDPIRKPPYGRKRRVKRGLYQSALGTLINADVNGALNHARKVAGDSVVPRIIGSGRVNRPVRIRTTFEPSPFAQIKVQPCAPRGAPVASPLR
ncbi:transposase (fragment) [Methanoculleus bourgensis]|uniref:Transposase n=1 Tax=Methanoculleus bourgensis TaxID=83986 RepID=A0A0X3BPX9_9EURY